MTKELCRHLYCNAVACWHASCLLHGRPRTALPYPTPFGTAPPVGTTQVQATACAQGPGLSYLFLLMEVEWHYPPYDK